MPAVVARVALMIVALSVAETNPPSLIGTWRSTPEDTPLSSAFDESVWGKDAHSIRVVEMTVKPTGDATLTVTRKVVDRNRREIKAATSIEHADLTIGPAQSSNEVRSDLAVTVTHAERRYPDDPSGNWPLDGLRVSVSTFTDDPARIEVRVDTPEGPGSFWETLRHAKPSPPPASTPTSGRQVK